jgi:hypothetical protein
LVDDLPAPVHPEPCLLVPGETITLGELPSIDAILLATIWHKRLRLTIREAGCGICVSVRHIKKGATGTLVCVVEPTQSSYVQLKSPIDTIAVMEVDAKTYQATLTCQRFGLARVTVVEEDPCGGDTWLTSLILDGVTSHWETDTRLYKTNQLVPVRLADGRLVALM